MDDAAARPEGEFSSALALHPTSEVLIRCKQDRSIGRQLSDQINGIAAGADQIALRFHRGRAVDVADHEVVGVLGPELGEAIRGAGVRQGAASLQVRQQHGLLRAEDLGDLGHEVHPTEDDDVRIGGGRLPGEFQRVADEISDVLDLRLLVVVGQDHGIALPFQRGDCLREIPVSRATGGGVLGCRENQGSGPKWCRMAEA